MPPTTPSTFSSSDHTYALVRELGQGGQGRTLLVEREGEPGSRYVLKLLRIEHVDDWKQVELFEREVSTLAALDHPGIPRLCDRIVEDERTAGIVQTFVEGRTLAQQIAEPQPLSPERFERILRECLEILAYLHEQVPPVLHRDINPRNVMLGPDRVFLIDFGAVRVGGKTDMTSVGTFGYMAPEQLIGRAQPASDAYGLGMTMVSLAERRDVGDLPIDPSTGQVDAAKLMRGVSPRVREVVLGMIKPGLGERLGDPREALRRLDGVPAALPAVAPTVALDRSGPEHGALVQSPQRLALVAIGTVLVLSLGAGFVMLSRGEPPVPVEVVPAQPIAVPPPPSLPEPPSSVEPPHRTAPERSAPVPPEAPAIEPIAELTEENSAQLHVVTTPPHAMVFIDRKGTCYSPCRVRVAFGRHDLRLEQNGRAVDRTVQVLEDTTLNVSLVVE